MKKTYIALVEQAPDGAYDISFPDIPGAHAQALTLSEVASEAADALSGFLLAAESVHLPVSVPSASVPTAEGQMAVIVTADTDAYSRAHDTTPVRKTVSIPSWMARRADERGISLSKALQDVLRSRLTE